MKLEYTKATVAGVWILAMCVLVYMASASNVNWAAAAVLAVVPILTMWRLWRVPQQTTSESINEARR
jgi:membrane protein YdbS with pleckstrin-like domain